MSWYDDIRSFTDLVNPLAENLYKIVLSLEALNPVLEKFVQSRAAYISSMRLSARKGRVILRGVYVPQEKKLRSLYDHIGFNLILEIESVNGNEVLLKVARTGLHNPGARLFDPLRWAAVLPPVRRSLATALVRAMPSILRTNEEANRLWFNTGYYLAKVPAYMNSLGDIRIVSVRARENRVLFYVNTNVIMVNFVDQFGPQYLSLEEIKYDQESIQMLWERE